MRKSLSRNNNKIFDSAKRHLVGGVDSPVRAFKEIGICPLVIKRGRGPRIYDCDGNSYIDYVLSFGAMILGHAEPSVVNNITKALRDGTAFGATTPVEIELAGSIKEAIPFIEKIRFVNSGTEAVMGAIRVARGYTGRDKILKFTNSYHGHADYLLAKSGSGLATLNIPVSQGVPRDYFNHTLIAEYGDCDSIRDIFDRYGKELAAVIVEPVGGNHGVICPDSDFLRSLRRSASQYGSLLIFDEVVTGFRFSFGAAADVLGIKPDLICLGKIIGGGLPVGAFGGPARIMKALAPEGKVYQASTFAGNPVVMAAGAVTLRKLRSLRKKYPGLGEAAEYICRTLEREAARRGIGVKVTNFGSMFSLKFAEKKDFIYFYRQLLSNGVYFAPSEYEANFISFVHTKQDIERTRLAIEAVFRL